jgi:hypothetical protein
MYAAWYPLAQVYELGDYGLIQDGVFQKLGNVRDLASDGFTTAIRSSTGPSTSVDYVSAKTKTIKMVAGAEVPQLPDGAVGASLAYQFEKANSFVVKAAAMTVKQMDNVREIADGLAKLRKNDKWTHAYRVVSATYTAEDALVLLAREANTKVEFSGEVSALKALNAGSIKVAPSVTSSSEAVLKSIGKSGILGLSLFKLNFWSSTPQLLKAGEKKEDYELEECRDELKDDIG